MGSIHIDLSALSQSVSLNGHALKDHKEVDFMPKPKVPMHLSFNNVCCYVPAHFEIPGIMSKVSKLRKALESVGKDKEAGQEPQERQEKQILHGITGVVNPGEVVAIMGPSGSGKTTFISLLAGRNKARHTGDILYNDVHKPTDKAFKRQLGYVTQEDSLYEGLTVFETLYYTAVLRLPRAMTDKDKRERVYIILEVLGISKVKDSIIGGFRIGRRGILGGEKKRVAIGQELLYNPSVVLLDEPTSGLDSTTALNLVHTLRTLAQVGNRTIITTIHQPSSRIYQMLDKLLLMGQGHLLYYGDASDAADYFASIGYTMPYGMNPADYFLDVASGWTEESKDCEEKLEALLESTDPELKALLGAIERKPYDRKTSEAFRSVKLASPKEEETSSQPGEDQRGPSYLTQMMVICTRSVKERRFELVNGDKLFQSTFMAVLCGVLWWQVGRGASLATLTGATNVSALLFFMVMFISTNMLMSSIFSFPNEKAMLTKEREAGTYPISAFFFGRTLADLPIDTAIPVYITTIIYVLAGLKPTVPAYLLTVIAILITCYTAASIGLFCGAAVLNVKRAMTLVILIMMTTIFAGGFFAKDMPVWISWLGYLSYATYGWDILMHIHTEGRVPECPPGNDSCAMLNGGPVQFSKLGPQFGILLLMFFVFRVAVYLSLRYGATKSKSKSR